VGELWRRRGTSEARQGGGRVNVMSPAGFATRIIVAVPPGWDEGGNPHRGREGVNSESLPTYKFCTQGHGNVTSIGQADGVGGWGTARHRTN